jgi:hypothetical protein
MDEFDSMKSFVLVAASLNMLGDAYNAFEYLPYRCDLQHKAVVCTQTLVLTQTSPRFLEKRPASGADEGHFTIAEMRTVPDHASTEECDSLDGARARVLKAFEELTVSLRPEAHSMRHASVS